MRYIKKLFILIIIALVYFYIIKQNVVLCEANENLLLCIKQQITEILSEYITTEDFKNKYGKSKLNPIFLTHYYTFIICDPKFVTEFMQILPLKEIYSNSSDEIAFIKQIEELFYLYVEKSIKAFENKINCIVGIALHLSVEYYKIFLYQHKPKINNRITNVENNPSSSIHINKTVIFYTTYAIFKIIQLCYRINYG